MIFYASVKKVKRVLWKTSKKYKKRPKSENLLTAIAINFKTK
jgi:hypothetical protein